VQSEPLLGQRFLSNFNFWTLDNHRHALLLGSQSSDRANSAGAGAAGSKPQVNAIRSPKIPELNPGNQWLVVASRSDLQEAISIGGKYKAAFPQTIVVKPENGYYGVVIGQFDVDQTPSILAQMVASNRVPKDTYPTLGARFVSIVWE
jgi:hypothetical protein